jgi:hypothetical protein
MRNHSPVATFVFWLVWFAIVLFATASLARCAYADDTLYAFAEFQQGVTIGESNWVGNYPTWVRAGVHWNVNSFVYFRAGVEHGSNIDRGSNLCVGKRCVWVVDDRDETFVNQLYGSIGIRYGLIK